MKKVLAEPLLHFLLLGALLFVVFGRVGDPAGAHDGTIVVSRGRIEQLSGTFAKTWQRPPTAEELQSLIDDFVLEEIYYRRAVAMGIDRDDTIIRRRLRQKLEFLTEDVTDALEPSEEELAAHLRANEDLFRRPSTYTFDQVYLVPEGDELEARVAKELASLRAGRAPDGGLGLVPPFFENASRGEVDRFFGGGFSAALDSVPLGEWRGPFESGLGLHLVRVDARVEGSLPGLAEIRSVVKREWENERRLESRRRVNERLLEDYHVVVEWPPTGPEGADDAT